jgi:precorrin-6B methylase 2
MVIKSWLNADNAELYEKMPLDFFMRMAAQGGLDTCNDVAAIESYINKASSILEIGAGYGRVIEFILKQNYNGQITAIERNYKLYQHLERLYSNKVTLVNADIQQVKLTSKYDLMLWMWTGICEFSKPEQQAVIKMLADYLAPNGFLIIDIIPIEFKTQHTIAYDKHNRIVSTPFGSDYGYFPDHFEIMEYIDNANLALHEQRVYYTSTNKEDHLYVIRQK